MVSFKVYYEANIANADHLKHEIISLLKTHSRTKPNLEPGSAIYKWFTNNLMKWLTTTPVVDEITMARGRINRAMDAGDPGQFIDNPEDLIGLEPHEYKEGEPEWMKKPDVVDFTDTANWPKLDHFIDYFNSLPDRDREKIVKKPFGQVDKEVADWDKELASKMTSSENKLKEDTDYEVIGKVGDYTWVKLSSKEAYECEGEGMGHCVGGYNPDDPDNTIISLWDKKGEPHVTIEISGRKDGYQEIRQIKGKQNAAPAEKYKDITAKFVRGWLDESPWNEDPADPDRLVAGDGANIGMISYPDWSGGRDTGTYYFFPDSKIWEAIHKKEIVPRQKHQVKSNQQAIHKQGSEKYIDGNLNLSYGYFKEIPKQLKVHAVEGDLNLQTNLLTSLKNAPYDVEGDLYAGANYIETLEGGPEIVRGDYKIAYNKLKNLKGLAKKIGGNLHIEGNPLESLDGAQDTVVMGKVFVGGWPVDMDDRGDVDRLATDTVGPVHRAAPDFMKADKIRAAFKTPQEGPDRGPGRMGLAYLPPRTQY